MIAYNCVVKNHISIVFWNIIMSGMRLVSYIYKKTEWNYHQLVFHFTVYHFLNRIWEFIILIYKWVMSNFVWYTYDNYNIKIIQYNFLYFFFNLWNFDILPNDLNVIYILTHTITLWVLINSKGIAHILKEFAFCYCKINNPCPPRAKQSITQRVVPYI